MNSIGHLKGRVSRHRRRHQTSREELVFRDPLSWHILDLLGTFVWLRTDQVCCLVEPASKATVGRRLRELYDQKLVERVQLPVNNHPIIHTLTERGAKRLRKRGYQIPYWKRHHLTPGRYMGDPLGYFKLEHPLLANEILIRLILSAKRQGVAYEYQDAASLVTKMKTVYPDKHLRLLPESDPGQAVDLFIEADTGEISEKQMMVKLERYSEYIFSSYPADFLNPQRPKGSPLVLIVTALEKRQQWREPRVVELCRWVHQFSREEGEEDFCWLFRISHLDFWEGEDLMAAPVWFIPGVSKRRLLLG